jgi:hypothetical protein
MPGPNDPNAVNPHAELAPLERALRELDPAPPGVSRERLLFEAGRASVVPPQRWLWQVVAGGFAVLACGFGATLAFRGPAVEFVYKDRVVERYVQAPAPFEQPTQPGRVEPEPSPAPSLERSAIARATEDREPDADARRMAQVRRDVLRWGVELLPEARPASPPAPPTATARDPELREWMKLTPGLFASPFGPLWRPPIRIIGGDE